MGWRAMHSESIKACVVNVSVVRFNAQLDNIVQPLDLIGLHWEILQVRAVFDELVSAELNGFMVIFAFESLRTNNKLVFLRTKFE